MADNDDLFDTDGEEEPVTGSSDADNAPAPQDGDSASGSESDSQDESERVKFWMSKAQKAEAALAKASKQKTPAARPAGDDSSEAPEVNEFQEFIKRSAQEGLFKEDPRLADFGFTVDDLAGSSLAEMRAARTRLVKVIEKAESRGLNAAYQRLGIDPSVAGGSSEKRDYASMTDEEFEKEIQRAKSLI